MYSACKLNKRGDNIKLCRTPFPIWKQPVVPCPVITVASWSAYRFLKRQVRSPVSHLFKNFPQFVVIHTFKGFGIVSKAGVDIFLENISRFWTYNFHNFLLNYSFIYIYIYIYVYTHTHTHIYILRKLLMLCIISGKFLHTETMSFIQPNYSFCF